MCWCTILSLIGLHINAQQNHLEHHYNINASFEIRTWMNVDKSATWTSAIAIVIATTCSQNSKNTQISKSNKSNETNICTQTKTTITTRTAQALLGQARNGCVSGACWGDAFHGYPPASYLAFCPICKMICRQSTQRHRVASLATWAWSVKSRD